MAKKKTAPAGTLKGWTAIAQFLGTSPASAQTWAKQGMPVKREGRFTVADPVEVQAWLTRVSALNVRSNRAQISLQLIYSFAPSQPA